MSWPIHKIIWSKLLFSNFFQLRWNSCNTKVSYFKLPFSEWHLVPSQCWTNTCLNILSLLKEIYPFNNIFMVLFAPHPCIPQCLLSLCIYLLVIFSYKCNGMKRELFCAASSSYSVFFSLSMIWYQYYTPKVFLFQGWIIFNSMTTIHFMYPLIPWWPFSLLPFLSYF